MSKQPKSDSPEVSYKFTSWHIGQLEGLLLTFIDASIQDPVQRKALKDVIRPQIWRWAIENNQEK